MTLDPAGLAMPARPGVYLMKGAGGRIVYIGKAKDLRRRVGSYFRGSHDYKTQKMVEKVEGVEFVITDSEAEAFVLESNLIKRYRPPYNIELKDQQRYAYLRITDEEYPRLLVARRTRDGRFLGGGRVFGPFTQGSSKALAAGTLRKSFKIRICNSLPKRACLEYHMGNCEAPCEFDAARGTYAGHVADLESVLRGRRQMDEFAGRLREEMARASDALEFEKAIELRDTLRRLGALRGEQKMERAGGAPDEDYVGVRVEGRTAHVMVLRQAGGVIRDRERFSFDLVADNSLAGFIYQYYTTRSVPRTVSVSEAPAGRAALEEALGRLAGRPVTVARPRRGRGRRLVDLILRNIDAVQSGGAGPGTAGLQEALGMASPPRVIECFDVSNHGDDYAVGAMSRMVDGEPDRAGYRRFRIRTVRGRDDFAMIAEIVKRRYLRLLGGGSAMPDLVVVDGGRGQLGAALGALGALSLDLPCVGLAKREEEVYVPGAAGPLSLPRDGAPLSILRHARDEAHRFGLAYNRRLRRIGPGGAAAGARAP